MTIINVMVDDQRLEFSSMPVVASEGVKETYVKFALSADWSGFGAVALFYRDDDEETVYESVLDGAGLAEVPYEVTAAPGWIRFGLSGSDGTSVHTSEILKYKVVKGKYTSGQGSEPPAPGIYEQMLAIAGQMRDTLNAAVIDQNAIIHSLEVDMSALETEQDNYENVITGRINTLVDNFAGSSRETVLYEGSDQTNIGTEIDLVSDPTVYDYLDIVLNDGLIGTIIGPTQNSQWRVTGETVKSTGASVTTYVIEGVLDAQSLCLRVSTACAIVDTGTASTRYDLGDGPLADESLRRYCLKVIGRKLTDDAEVLDIRVGANGTVYQTAGTAVRSQITALTDNLSKKLTTPLTSGGNADYGVSGQLLATDGTGNTEWVDNAGPTDEQVETFINAWLDDHPEATTTVQDNSLTYKKLVTGTLGYVTPEDYGAVGDGVTDDSEAINLAIASGFPVWFDGSKTYAIANMVSILNDCVIFGNGATILENGFGSTHLIEARNCNLTIHDLVIEGDPASENVITGITIYSCVSQLNNLVVKNVTSHSIVISDGKAVLSDIIMNNVGKKGNYSFVYLTENSETNWNNVFAFNDVLDTAPQCFYISSGHHAISNVQVYNTKVMVDVRNGSTTVTNGYCYNTCGVICQTSVYNEGADITISNVVFNNVIGFDNTNTLINIRTCKNLTLKDCVMIVSASATNATFLMKFEKPDGLNKNVDRVVIDNLNIIGDGIVTNGIYAKNTLASDIILKNCQFPVLSNGSAYVAVVYGTDLARFVFENCTFKNKTNNLYVYDNVGHAPYENVIVRSRYKQRGTTAERPVLWRYYESNIYYDTDLSKLILWNGTAWVNLDGTTL